MINVENNAYANIDVFRMERTNRKMFLHNNSKKSPKEDCCFTQLYDSTFLSRNYSIFVVCSILEI